jgi:hypothetical protein
MVPEPGRATRVPGQTLGPAEMAFVGIEIPSDVRGTGDVPRRPSLRRTAAFPCAVLLAALVLGMLGISGSSVGIYGTGVGASEDDAGVLAGPVRPIRSDEWLVRTPWLVRQIELGLPSRAAGGVGSHDVAVLADLPTRSWEAVLRPHTMPYQLATFLGPSRAFALEWWLLVGVQLVGVYTLLLVLTQRPALSATAALLMTLSPAVQWWAVPAAFVTIGYGSLAAAGVLSARRATSGRRQLLLGAGAGLALGAFLSTLYVPWQVGTGIVLGATTAGALLPDMIDRSRRRAVIRRVATVATLAVVVGGGLFAAFVVNHRDAAKTISETVYPGDQPANEGGTASLPILWGSAFDSFAAAEGTATANGTNQSENSSALLFVLPVAIVLAAIVARHGVTCRRLMFPLFGTLGGAAVLLSWMLLPLPAIVGMPLLLTRTAPGRLFLPVGFASVVALALLVHLQTSRRMVPTWVAIAAAGSFGFAQAWAAGRYLVDGRPIDRGAAALLVVVVTVATGVAVEGRRSNLGLGVLLALVAWQASLINPVQAGLDPLTEGPLRRAVDDVASDGASNDGWVAYDADPLVKGILTASGVNHLSGISPYPDETSWRALDPEGDDRQVWNRYAHVGFTPGTAEAAPTITLTGNDALTVTVDPCSSALDRLGVRYVVTQDRRLDRCVEQLQEVQHGDGFVVLYRRASS